MDCIRKSGAEYRSAPLLQLLGQYKKICMTLSHYKKRVGKNLLAFG